jgi:hypothetical protein
MRKAPLYPIGKDPIEKKFFVQTVTPWQSIDKAHPQRSDEACGCLKKVKRT